MSQITLAELHLIRRFLKARVRPPEIARKTGLGLGTVIRVAGDRKLRRRKLDRIDPADLPEDDVPPEYVAANLRRCPGCGGMVYRWPCLACRLRGVGVRECEGVGVIDPPMDKHIESAACGDTFEPTPSGVGDEHPENEAA